MAVRDGPLLPKVPGGSSGCFAAFLLGRHGIVALKTALMLPYEGLGRGTLSRYTHRAGKTEKIKNPPLKSSEIKGQASDFLSFFTAKIGPDRDRSTMSASRPLQRAEPSLSEDRLDHLAVDVGEPVVTPLEAEGQTLVVNAQLMERCGLKIVNVHRILDDVVAELVGAPVAHSSSNATARHPDRETPRVVVAPVVRRRELALRIIGAPKLAAPND